GRRSAEGPHPAGSPGGRLMPALLSQYPALPYYLALAAAILGGIGGQLLLKAGSVGAAGTVEQLLRLPTLAGLGFYAASAVLYVIALRRIPVSIAFPSVSVSYAVIAVIGYLVWS